LRSLGANIKIIFALFASEAFFIVAGGIVLGNILLTLLLAFMPQNISFMPSLYELFLLLVMLILALLASLIPAIQSYKNSLHDGLSIKL
jgi:putative ABC transport system permease protein